jgi:hypothetical protein
MLNESVLLFHVLILEFERWAGKENCDHPSAVLIGGVDPPVHSCTLDYMVLWK